MPDWPTTLPVINAGGTEEKQDGVIRTPMDAGPSQARRRFSARSVMISGSMLLTAAQKNALDTFYDTTLSDGSLSFTHKDPKDLSDKSFRFAGPVSYSYVAGSSTGVALYQASVKFEILP